MNREAVRRNELHHDGAERAGHARIERAHAERQRFVDRAVDAHRSCGDRIIADRHHGPPGLAVDQVRREPKHEHGHEQREKIQPLIIAQREPKRCGRLDDDEPLDTSRPSLEQRQLEDLRCCYRQSECRKGEIKAIEPQRRQPEQKAADEADDSRDWYRERVVETCLVHQYRCRIRPDGKKCRMAQRELAVEPEQQVQPDDGDRIHHHHRDLKNHEAFDRKWQTESGDSCPYRKEYDDRTVRRRPACHAMRCIGADGAVVRGELVLHRHLTPSALPALRTNRSASIQAPR